MIYLDNAATSFVKPEEVKNSVYEAIEKYTANPGRSGHKLSQDVGLKIFETRELVKKFFNSPNHEVIFTKNCSEALNLAIFGLLKNGDHVIITCYEHNSVLRPLEQLKNNGVEITVLFCEMEDVLQNIKNEVRKNTRLIITNFVSNVTGEICDVKSIGKFCKTNKILYLVDGAQAAGHITVDVENMNIDLFVFAGHKGLFSLTGVGGLVVKNGLKLKPILYGGTGTESGNLSQPITIPEGYEVGTIPTIPIISLNAGLKFLMKNFPKIIKKEEKLSNLLYFSLKKLKFLKIYSKNDSLNVFSFNVENLDCMTVSNILNEKFNICVRAGLHCAPLIHKKLGTENIGAVRVSLDCFNTEKEIKYLVFALKKIYDKNIF